MTRDPNWKPVPCTNHDADCGIWKTLEYDAATCPTCKAHVRNGICLNTCHLTPDAQARFAAIMRGVK